MAEPFIIDVDGIPVEVDEDLYATQPDLIFEAVRKARAEYAGALIDEPAPDYDELDAVAAASPVPE